LGVGVGVAVVDPLMLIVLLYVIKDITRVANSKKRIVFSDINDCAVAVRMMPLLN
jgi:hypothetical protein